MFSTRFGEPIELLPRVLLPRVLLLELLPVVLLPVVLLLPLVLEFFMFWLRSCQGTGISLPVSDALDELLLLGVPETLERLEGTVSRPDVEVSLAPPADESDSTANWMRPLCGSTITSRMLPSVLPS